MKILIVEDERDLAESIAEYISKEPMVCEIASNFEEGMKRIALYDYDCILLDIGLPDGNGLTLLEELKARKKMDGVIIISARDSVDDKVRGLNLGADDYISKPIHLSELNARIKSLIRRKYFDASDELQAGNLNVNLLTRTVSTPSETLAVTKKEYDILIFLIANQKKVVSKSSLAEHTWGDDIDQADSFYFIYTHIKNLNKKLKQSNAGVQIKNVYGVGYKLVEE